MAAPRTKQPMRRRVGANAKALATPEEAHIPQDVDDEIRKLMVETFLANKKMNDAKKAHDARRAQLLELMQKHKRDHYTAEHEGTIYKAIVEASSSRVVDVNALREQVSDEVFMACIKANVTDVEKFAGKAVANEVSETKKGNTNVTIKTEAKI